MSKIIILNGPPCCGKDTLANHVFKTIPYSSSYFWVEHGSFAKPLKQILQIVFNLTDAEVKEYDTNHILKNTPQERFQGKSWRQCCIDLSLVLKEKFGQDYFGTHLANRIDMLSDSIANKEEEFPNIIVTDGGFEEETIPLINRYGAENIKVIKLIRKGFDYTGDSRKYLDCKTLGLEQIVLENIVLDKYLKDGYSLILDIMSKS